MMYCAAIGTYNKQARDIIEAMGAWQLSFEDAAERLEIRITPKLVEVYNKTLAQAFEKACADEPTAYELATFEELLANPV